MLEKHSQELTIDDKDKEIYNDNDDNDNNAVKVDKWQNEYWRFFLWNHQ